jgi:hypothetical protein
MIPQRTTAEMKLLLLGAFALVSLASTASIGHRIDTAASALSPPTVAGTERRTTSPIELQLFPTSGQEPRERHSVGRMQEQHQVEGVSKDWLSLSHAGAVSSSSSGIERSAEVIPHFGKQHSEQHGEQQGEQPDRYQQQARQVGAVDSKRSFLREYNRLKLGSVDDAKDLAIKVREIKTSASITPQVAGKWMRAQTRRNKGVDFAAAYKKESRGLSNRLSQLKMYQPKRKVVIGENAIDHLQKLDMQKVAGSRRAPTPYEQARQHKVTATIARAGQVFEKHFRDKKMDLAKMSTEEIEEEARLLEPPVENGKSQFQRLVYRYLEQSRPMINMNRYRELRESHNHKVYHENRKQKQHL